MSTYFKNLKNAVLFVVGLHFFFLPVDNAFALNTVKDPTREKFVNFYEIPPSGNVLSEVIGYVFDSHELKYKEIPIKIFGNNYGVYIYGEYERRMESKNTFAYMANCVFLERLPFDLDNRLALSPLEQELLLVLDRIEEIEFSQWERFSLSAFNCTQTNDFKISLQFGINKEDKLISLRIPNSCNESDGYSDMTSKQESHCVGEDVFFDIETLLKILNESYSFKTSISGFR